MYLILQNTGMSGDGGQPNVSTVRKMFIGGLKESTTREELEEYFVRYGEIKDVELPLEKVSRRPRGFAFITFDDYDSVDQCVCEWLQLKC